MKPLPDELDLRILAELEIDARASTTDIAKKAGVSMNTVKTHIEEMEHIGLIKGYSIKVDYMRFGYQSNRVYLKLQHTNSSIESGMIDYLKKSQFCSWASFARGKFDLGALFWTKNYRQFIDTWNDFKKQFKPYIRDAMITRYLGESTTCFPFTKEIYPNHQITIGIDEPTAIDEVDLSLLRILSTNGRATYSDIGKSLALTPSAVKYRMDALTEKKVIVAPRTRINFGALGYSFYKVDFDLEKFEENGRLEKWMLEKPNAPHIIRSSSGADAEVQLCVKSSKELDSILKEAKDEFSETLRSYEIHEFTHEIKSEYMPEF